MKTRAMEKAARYFMNECQEKGFTADEMLDDIRKMVDWMPGQVRRAFHLYSFETQWELMWQEWFVQGNWVCYNSDMWELAEHLFGEFDREDYSTEHMRRTIGNVFAKAMMPAVYDRFGIYFDPYR